MRRRLITCVVAIAIAVGGCTRSADSDKAFNAKVRSYLMAHPEVIGDALQKLQVKLAADDAAEQARASAALPKYRALVERDPRDFVANPAGRVTVTEFYDYRCPHCVNAAPKVLALIRANPDVRFVFKESPIFGPTSEHAARAAIAVKKAGGDYLALYRTFMETRPLDDAAIDRIALRFGAAKTDLASMPAADTQIRDVADLFQKLDLEGTPAFIVGPQIISGEDMDAVNSAIASARQRTVATRPS